MKDYKKILEGVVNIVNTTEKIDIGFANICTYIGENCPELRESEDERVRKALIRYFTLSDEHAYNEACGVSYRDIVAWLEKQGEKKSFDYENANIQQKDFAPKVEPKFKIGAWVVFNNKHQSIYQVEKIEDGYYILRHTHGGTFRVCVLHDESLRLWTIQDAKDGDVLTTLNHIIIFEKVLSKNGGISHCHYDFGSSTPQFNFNKNENWYFGKEAIIHPATKEQREFLFQKMKEAGYKWDADKKELKKVEQNLAWSEEDEDNIVLIQMAIYSLVNDGITSTDATRLCDWLKSLKDRVQPKQEWSEEDKEMIDNIIDYMMPMPIFFESTKGKSGKKYTQEFIKNATNWLESLKHQKQWKPTKNQIDALFAAVYLKALRNTLEKDSVKQLEELYNQLKKLKE